MTVPIVVDFQGVAGLIDSVLGANPRQLENLLRVLSSSAQRLEARVILELVVRCRDPLAPLVTLCRDALKTAADLDIILTPSQRRGVSEICPPGHANAILNLCDTALRRPNPHSAKRRERIRRIRPQVKVAAVAELSSRRDDIERIQEVRDSELPDLWCVFETYLAKYKTGARSLWHGSMNSRLEASYWSVGGAPIPRSSDESSSRDSLRPIAADSRIGPP